MTCSEEVCLDHELKFGGKIKFLAGKKVCHALEYIRDTYSYDGGHIFLTIAPHGTGYMDTQMVLRREYNGCMMYCRGTYAIYFCRLLIFCDPRSN